MAKKINKIENLHKNIRDLRLSRHWTQKEFGKHIGVKDPVVSLYENGERVPTLDVLIRIAKVFDLSLDELVGLKDLSLSKTENQSIKIPVVGSIHAGDPTTAFEDKVDEVEIPQSWTDGGKDWIGLLVTGDSMTPEYQPGDYVLLEITVDFNTGDDVVVYIDGYDSTLKRARKIGNRVIFYPLNEKYNPITCGPGPNEHKFQVFGVVRELRRQKSRPPLKRVARSKAKSLYY